MRSANAGGLTPIDLLQHHALPVQAHQLHAAHVFVAVTVISSSDDKPADRPARLQFIVAGGNGTPQPSERQLCA